MAVLTYQGEQLLPACLHSIQTTVFPVSTELLVLDNGSVPPTPWEWPYEMPTNVITRALAREPVNRGNIGGQNACFEQANGEWVLFLANDVRLQPDTIRRLWMCKEGLPSTLGQLQPLCMTRDQIDQGGMRWMWPGYGISYAKDQTTPYRVSIVPSTCYLMRKAVWKSLGGFDERLGSSHEDVDMGLRLAKAGYVNYCYPNVRVEHLKNQTLKHTLSNHRQVFHQSRQQIIRKHYQGLDQWVRSAVEALTYVTTQPLPVIRPRWLVANQRP